MPIINPRVPGDLPYPFRTAIGKAALNFGGVIEITIGGAATADYVVGDELTIGAPPSGGIQAKAIISQVVENVGEFDEPTEITITNPGAGYTAPPAVSGGSGTGSTFTAVLTGTSPVPVDKGNIYTTDAEGRLIVPVAVVNDAVLQTGILQAIETTVIGDGNEFVQVVTPPGRILLLADVDLKKNDLVSLKDFDATTTIPNKVKLGVTGDTGLLGRIFEIETKNADGSVKIKTEDGDVVAIDLGVGA